MRAQNAVFLVLAGGVAGCAITSPPPPPMAIADPSPALAPTTMKPIDGNYTGSVVATDDSRPRCRKLPGTATTTVRNNVFALGTVRSRVGPDGAVKSLAPHRTTMTGMVSNGVFDVTTMAQGCGYHYSLAQG